MINIINKIKCIINNLKRYLKKWYYNIELIIIKG
jgi:hypothetical protein